MACVELSVLQMTCVVLSVFTDGLCRIVCLFLQMACVELLFLHMTCVELSVFVVGLCRTVCFCR